MFWAHVAPRFGYWSHIMGDSVQILELSVAPLFGYWSLIMGDHDNETTFNICTSS